MAISLQAIVDGTDFVWGDFTDVVVRDPDLDSLRLKVLALELSHPPGPNDYDVSAEGREIIKGYIRELRSGGSSWLLP